MPTIMKEGYVGSPLPAVTTGKAKFATKWVALDLQELNWRGYQLRTDVKGIYEMTSHENNSFTIKPKISHVKLSHV